MKYLFLWKKKDVFCFYIIINYMYVTHHFSV